MIDHCKSLVSSMDTRKATHWKERMSILKENWAKSRSAIFDNVVSAENRQSDKCLFCGVRDAFVRCHGCGLFPSL